MYSSVSFLIFTTLMDVGGIFGGAFVGGGALVGGGAFVGGGSTNFSFGSGGTKLSTTRGGAAGGGFHSVAAGGGLHSGSGRFAHGFSSESLGENVELLLNSDLILNRALFVGFTDSAVLILSMFGTGGGGGRS